VPFYKNGDARDGINDGMPAGENGHQYYRNEGNVCQLEILPIKGGGR
jgi:hypothetical protein